MEGLREKVLKQIEYLEAEIECHQRRLEVALNDFRKSAGEYDSYNIVTFIPGMVRDIEQEREKIAVLDEQCRMLVWMLKED